MKILFWEMRRYLKPITLLIIAVFSVFWYTLYGDINKGQRHDHGWLYQLTVEYKQRFGTTIDREELEEIKQDYAAFLEELDAMVEKYMGAYDIHSQAEYQMLENAALEGEDYEYYDEAVQKWGAENIKTLYDDKCGFRFEYNHPLVLMWDKALAYESVLNNFAYRENLDIEQYYEQESHYEENQYNLVPAALERMKECNATGEISLLNAVYLPDAEMSEAFAHWMWYVFIVCAAIVIPFPVNNRTTNVQAMQFATKTGKLILIRQLGAALLITVLVNLATYTFFCGVAFYGPYNIRHLLDCPVSVGRLWDAYWFDMTFLQYILRVIVTQTLIPSLVFTCLLFLLTCFCKNYIPAIAATIPLIFAVVYWFNVTLDFYPMRHPRFVYPLALSGTLAVTAAAAALILQRIRRTDYLY